MNEVVNSGKSVIKVNNRTKYCTNCGKHGHEYKNCRDPITSIGIILMRFDYREIKQVFDNMAENDKKDNNQEQINIENKNIIIKDIDDIQLFSLLQNMIKFMLICRKHTLGYSEFIRGRYKPENVDGIIYLFQQMVQDEINKIAINKTNLSYLWDDFWIDPLKKVLYQKDFQESKQKFEALSNNNESELTLDYYVSNVNPLWKNPEWGFPKGRRNKIESNIECAIREFEEETGFTNDDYVLLEGIKPLVEELIGTDAIRYRHIYYVAYAINDKIPKIDMSNINQISEIGDIGYYTYNDVMNMIRSHHVERKKLLEKLFMYTCEKIISEFKNKI